MTIPNINFEKPEKKISIMIIDDKLSSIRTLMKILDSPEFDLKPTASPSFALRSATAYPPDLILLAVEVQGREGGEIFQKFQAYTTTASIPVIFTGTPSSLKKKTEEIPRKYINCIPHPFEPDKVIEKIHSCLSAHGKQIKTKSTGYPLYSHENEPETADDVTPASDTRGQYTYTILVVDDQEILPLGGIRRKKVDCCVIAATNQDLDGLTQQGRFRRDLFFRLNTFMIHIPALRQRAVDIVKMVEFFLDIYNREYQVQRRITAKALHQLQAYPFPGNVRELQNIMRKAVVLSENDVLDDFLADSIGAGDKTPGRKTDSPEDPPYPIRLQDKVQALEKRILSDAFKRFRSTRKVAQNLGTSQSSVMRKMKKYRLGNYSGSVR
jgi:TyrR family helix-turn-helix protein